MVSALAILSIWTYISGREFFRQSVLASWGLSQCKSNPNASNADEVLIPLYIDRKSQTIALAYLLLLASFDNWPSTARWTLLGQFGTFLIAWGMPCSGLPRLRTRLPAAVFRLSQSECLRQLCDLGFLS